MYVKRSSKIIPRTEINFKNKYNFYIYLPSVFFFSDNAQFRITETGSNCISF